MAQTGSPQQGFPQITLPLVTNQGYITQTWLQLFISLWNRTGGGEGQVGVAPSGSIMAFPSETPPDGWIVADGSAVSRTSYNNLFQVVGITFGAGDGTNTFNLPNLVGRVIVGAGNEYPFGTTGGSPTSQLGLANLPAHNHDIQDSGHTHTVNDPGHTHGITDPMHTHTVTDPGHHHSVTTAASASTGTTGTDPVGVTTGTGTTGTSATGITIGSSGTGVTVVNSDTGITNNTSQTGITTKNTGSGQAFSLIQPYIALTPCIKT